jgi:hypothetical protein
LVAAMALQMDAVMALRMMGVTKTPQSEDQAWFWSWAWAWAVESEIGWPPAASAQLQAKAQVSEQPGQVLGAWPEEQQQELVLALALEMRAVLVHEILAEMRLEQASVLEMLWPILVTRAASS